MGLLTPDYDMVTKVTILPRTNGAGGFTLFTPTEERLESGLYSKRYLKGQLAVALGGRVAEELVYGEDEVTTGASSDLQQVRNIARRMVAQWGFTADDEVTADMLVGWEAPDAGRFTARTASGETEARIDLEVRRICDKAYENCYATLAKHRGLMDELTDQLIDKETVRDAPPPSPDRRPPRSPRLAMISHLHARSPLHSDQRARAARDAREV